MIIALIERIDGGCGVPWTVAIHEENIGALIITCATRISAVRTAGCRFQLSHPCLSSLSNPSIVIVLNDSPHARSGVSMKFFYPINRKFYRMYGCFLI
jgi:hypothetical protein